MSHAKKHDFSCLAREVLQDLGRDSDSEEERFQGQRVTEEARLQAAEEVRHWATAKEARREAEEEARQKAEVEPRRKAAARGEEEKMGLRERYEALGPEGSFFFCRAMGLESDADLV